MGRTARIGGGTMTPTQGNRMKLNRAASAIAAMITAGATIAAPAASGAVTMGPGSPIRMPEPGAVVEDGRHVRTGMCSTGDRKSTRLNSSHQPQSRMPSSA